jgi:hypothetical protein
VFGKADVSYFAKKYFTGALPARLKKKGRSDASSALWNQFYWNQKVKIFYNRDIVVLLELF